MPMVRTCSFLSQAPGAAIGNHSRAATDPDAGHGKPGASRVVPIRRVGTPRTLRMGSFKRQAPPAVGWPHAPVAQWIRAADF